jgi:hypothetical protein
MRFVIRLSVVALSVATGSSCQQASLQMTGPSPITLSSSAANLDPSSGLQWGATSSGMHSADVESGFVCGLGPHGSTTDSHATRSASGNETVTCHAQSPLPPPTSAMIETGFPCELHFGDGDPTTRDFSTNSRAVVTPSGNVTLVCKS